MINDYFNTFVNYWFFTYNECIYHLKLWLPTTLLPHDRYTTGSFCSIFDILKKYLNDVVKVITSLIDNKKYIYIQTVWYAKHEYELFIGRYRHLSNHN